MTGVHINKPGKSHYMAHVRKSGHKIWERVGDYFPTEECAYTAMATAFATGKYKRAVLRSVEIEPSYYEPILIAEWTRR